MILDILICTYNEGVYGVEKILLKSQKNIKYKISHQITDMKYKVIPESLKRSDVEISQIYSSGLSKNRNNVLNISKGDICLIADDDVSFKKEYFRNIFKAFEENKEVDIITFKIKVSNSDEEYKNYSNKKYYIKKKRSLSSSSIEIAFRRKKIIEKKLKFDVNFGLGSKYRRGEEKIFMADAISKGLNLMYVPEYIVEHELESSVKSRKIDRDYAIEGGAIAIRIYGIFGLLLNFYSTFKLYSRYKREMSFLNYLFFRMYGSLLLIKKEI